MNLLIIRFFISVFFFSAFHVLSYSQSKKKLEIAVNHTGAPEYKEAFQLACSCLIDSINFSFSPSNEKKDYVINLGKGGIKLLKPLNETESKGRGSIRDTQIPKETHPYYIKHGSALVYYFFASTKVRTELNLEDDDVIACIKSKTIDRKLLIHFRDAEIPERQIINDNNIRVHFYGGGEKSLKKSRLDTNISIPFENFLSPDSVGVTHINSYCPCTLKIPDKPFYKHESFNAHVNKNNDFFSFRGRNNNIGNVVGMIGLGLAIWGSIIDLDTAKDSFYNNTDTSGSRVFTESNFSSWENKHKLKNGLIISGIGLFSVGVTIKLTSKCQRKKVNLVIK